MKITHLSQSNATGGAATYVARTIDSTTFVGIENKLLASSLKYPLNNMYIVSDSGSKKFNFLRAKTSQTLDKKIRIFEKTQEYRYKSLNFMGAVSSSELNKSSSDIIHLHWINGGLISIKQIGKIKKPLVWTMLDMWPFLGGEHYLLESDLPRFIDGYYKHNRPNNDYGVDLCKVVWNQKKKYYGNLHLISPSKWLASQASSSVLFYDKKIEIIPPPIDIDLFKPMPKKQAREKYKIDDNLFVIGFLGGVSERKGWEYVYKLCSHTNLNSDWRFLLGGASINSYSKYKDIGRTTILAGKLNSNQDLVSFYASLDVLVVPSIAEAYGLVAQEAQSCGIPVIVFSGTGAVDTILNGCTGFVAEQKSVLGLLKILEHLYMLTIEQRNKISHAARARAKNEWNYKVIGDRHMNFYSNVSL